MNNIVLILHSCVVYCDAIRGMGMSEVTSICHLLFSFARLLLKEKQLIKMPEYLLSILSFERQ